MDGFPDFIHVSHTQDGKGDWLSPVFQFKEFLEYIADRVVVIGSEKNRLLIEESGHNGIDDSIGLAGAGRALDIGSGIFHGVVDRQKLV